MVRLPVADDRSAPTARRSSAGTPRRFTDRRDPARAPGRHRADRREHRPRQGGRRDDRPRPRPGHGQGDRRRRLRHRARLVGRRLPHHDLRREHRRHGGHPGLLHGRLLRGRGRRDPLRPLAQVRRPRGLDPRRRARRHHRRALRHDRPARRQDLEGERGRLRQPDQPRARSPPASSSASATSRSTSPRTSRSSGIALGTIVAIAGYHLARAIAPKELRERADGAGGTAIAVGDHVYGDSDGVDDLYQEGYPGAPGHRDPERDKRP